MTSFCLAAYITVERTLQTDLLMVCIELYSVLRNVLIILHITASAALLVCKTTIMQFMRRIRV